MDFVLSFLILQVIVALVFVLGSRLERRHNIPLALVALLVGLAWGLSPNALSFLPSAEQGVTFGFLVTITSLFVAAMQLRLTHMDSLHKEAGRVVIVALLLSLIALPLFLSNFVNLPLSLGILFVLLASATTPFIPHLSAKSLRRAEYASVFGAVIAVGVLFLLLDGATLFLTDGFLSFIMFLALAAGVGVVIGIIFLRILSSTHLRLLGLVGAMLTYVLAELLNTSGMLSALVYGFFLAQSFERSKWLVLQKLGTVEQLLETGVLILFAARVVLEKELVLLAIVAFLLFALTQFVATYVVRLSSKERLQLAFLPGRAGLIAALGLLFPIAEIPALLFLFITFSQLIHLFVLQTTRVKRW